MTRKNIFELIKEKYNLQEEMDKIYSLFESSRFKYQFGETVFYTIEGLADIYFIYWKQRGSCINCEDMKNKIQLSSNFNDFQNIINTLEYYLNIIYIIDNIVYKVDMNQLNLKHCNNYKMLLQNIHILLDNINYEKKVFDDEEKVIIVPKNPTATAVAEITSDNEVSYAILKYNHSSLKGQLNEKRQILLSIANEYEHILKKNFNGFSEYFNLANNILNNFNIRHNNKEGKNQNEYINQINNEELEKWYDELYQLILFCVLIDDNIKRKKKLNDELNKINGKPENKE